jgi:serine/threonine-protein kinase RsbW
MPDTQSSIYKKKRFMASFKNLEKISLFVGKTAQKIGFDEDTIYSIQLAVDEACANIIEHGYGERPKQKITCICSFKDGDFTIQLVDHGRKFDPRHVPEPDLKANLQERSQGGLGVFFIRQLMDEVHFSFGTTEDGSPGSEVNILTMVKRKG